MIEMAILGKRKRGRPKRRWMDLVRKDMEMVRAREGKEVDRVTPNREKPKEDVAYCRRDGHLSRYNNLSAIKFY